MPIIIRNNSNNSGTDGTFLTVTDGTFHPPACVDTVRRIHGNDGYENVPRLTQSENVPSAPTFPCPHVSHAIKKRFVCPHVSPLTFPR